MRLAYVCTDPGVPVFGSKGCSIHVQEVLRGFVRRGWQVDLFARRVDGDPPADLKSVQLIRLESPGRDLDATSREQRLLELDRPLRIQLAKFGPYDLVYERYALWSSAAMAFASDNQTPSILEVNAPLIEEQARYRELIAVSEATRVTREAFSHAHTLAAVSSGVADYLGEILESRHKIHVVPNGVDLQRFAATRRAVRSRWQSRVAGSRWAQPVVIGFVGTLRAWHGMETLGQAFREFYAQNPAARLLVVGDGPARTQLMEALGEATVATTITGKVSPASVPDYLAQVDMAVAPYPAGESFYFSPLKVVEYMACGLPTVASRIGDIPRLVQPDVNGVLVAPGDAAACCRAWRQLSENPERAMALGAQAIQTVQQSWTWDHAVGQMLALATHKTNSTSTTSPPIATVATGRVG